MRIDDRGSIRLLHFDGPVIATPDDASEIIGNAWGGQAGLVVITVDQLDPEFFRLRSLLAGEVIQKLVNYRIRLAIVGDISDFTAESDALRDFVWESNRGEQVWFLPDAEALESRLEARWPR